MYHKILRFTRTISLALFLLGTVFVTTAQAGGGEEAPSQTPFQVIVQIMATAIVLKVLERFGLP
jgi:type IV secretory pathway VirB2 component (pilin)